MKRLERFGNLVVDVAEVQLVTPLLVILKGGTKITAEECFGAGRVDEAGDFTPLCDQLERLVANAFEVISIPQPPLPKH